MPEGFMNRRADNWRPLLGHRRSGGRRIGPRINTREAALTLNQVEDGQELEDHPAGGHQEPSSATGRPCSPMDLANRLKELEGRPWPEYGRSRKHDHRQRHRPPAQAADGLPAHRSRRRRDPARATWPATSRTPSSGIYPGRPPFEPSHRHKRPWRKQRMAFSNRHIRPRCDGCESGFVPCAVDVVAV